MFLNKEINLGNLNWYLTFGIAIATRETLKNIRTISLSHFYALYLCKEVQVFKLFVDFMVIL